jgi:hypothetical protein
VSAALSSYIASLGIGAQDPTNDPIADAANYAIPNARFLTPKETYMFINEDRDGYVARMDEARIYLHLGFQKKSEYISSAATTAVGYTPKEAARLARIARAVEIFMNAYFGTTPQQHADVRWQFALTEGVMYENGEPHIRDGIIFWGTRYMYKIIDDSCALGWELLYWRLGIFASKCLIPSHVIKRIWEFIPWAANNTLTADWQLTCQFFKRAEDKGVI